MISANDNKGYTSQQKSQIMEAIDILADHKLSASYVMGCIPSAQVGQVVHHC